jgi:hypothetical protein
MTKSASSTKCPRCGNAASGRFCATCGAALEGAACAECGKLLSGTARFCHHCGTPTGDAVHASASPRNVVAWLVPGIAVLALVAFLIGQRVGRGSSATDAESTTPLATGGVAPFAGGGGRATDISQMPPDERASRLFDRVMRYGEEGKQDSAKIFAPMAIQAYEMLGALDAHNRYDIGMIGAVSGDAALAGAEADTILAKNHNHLLGLILAIKAADLRGDVAARVQYQKRLVAVEPVERARKLKEYEDHKSDIDAALNGVRNVKP